MGTCASNQPQRRLGTRVRAQIPLRVRLVDGENIFSEDCHTLMVNPQGCGIRCSRPLAPGLQVQIDELPGRVSTVARVACARPLSDNSKYWIVGISLESPGNWWYLAPTPSDWGVYSAPPKFLPSSVKRASEDRPAVRVYNP